MFVIDYSDQMSGVCVLQRQARLLGVMQRAHDCSLLKEEYYKKWVRLRLYCFKSVTFVLIFLLFELRSIKLHKHKPCVHYQFTFLWFKVHS